jgi:hypothetical protein
MARKPEAAELTSINRHVRVLAHTRVEIYVSALHQQRRQQLSLSSLTPLLTSTHNKGGGETNPAS